MLWTTLTRNPDWTRGEGEWDRSCRYWGRLMLNDVPIGYVQLWPRYLVRQGKRVGSRLPIVRVKIADEVAKLQAVQEGRSILLARGSIGGEYDIAVRMKPVRDVRRAEGDQTVLRCEVALTPAEEEDVWFATPASDGLDLDEARRFFPDAGN